MHEALLYFMTESRINFMQHVQFCSTDSEMTWWLTCAAKRPLWLGRHLPLFSEWASVLDPHNPHGKNLPSLPLFLLPAQNHHVSYQLPSVANEACELFSWDFLLRSGNTALKWLLNCNPLQLRCSYALGTLLLTWQVSAAYALFIVANLEKTPHKQVRLGHVLSSDGG